MKIPSINAYLPNLKNKTPKFKSSNHDWDYAPKIDCFKTDKSELFNKYGAYSTSLTYNEILAMKKIAEKSEKNGYIPNIIVAFYPSALGGIVCAMSETDVKKGIDAMEDITDTENL